MANKECLVACAGSGKTTFLVSEVWEHYCNDSVIFVTFTINNQRTISNKIRAKFGYLPSKIKVMGWYEFLFKFFILPYKADIIPSLNVRNISLCFDSDYSRTYTTKEGKTFSKYRKDDKEAKYLTKSRGIHKDLASEFAYQCLTANTESIALRLNESANVICFDESQDFGGYDYKIIYHICRRFTGKILIATDPRQYIYSTSKYAIKDGGKIHLYISNKINTKTKKYVNIDTMTLSYSHRCIDEICKLASMVFPKEPATLPCNCLECTKRKDNYSMTKGVFAVKESDIEMFINKYSPLCLIYSQSEKLPKIGRCMTMGDSKGCESDVVLLYPTDDMSKFIFKDRETVLKPQTQCKLYVGITRAKYCLGVVYRQKCKFDKVLLPFWENEL